jgi:phosphonoacetaldehyde hydrolase
MTTIANKSPYTGPVKAVVLDWAGTAVDYGCMGPAAVFVDVFARFDITASTAEARRFMGLEKKAHIRAMCELPKVIAQWRETYGKAPDAAAVDALYELTEPMMVAAIARHADPIPGLLEFAAAMRARGIKIGSCTGYTTPMVAALAPAAADKGYAPDAVVCASEVPAGRPEPWMCYLNAIQLQVRPFAAMVKIGDTISDILEGLNAGMWTIGLTQSGNELGMTEAEVNALERADLDQRLKGIEARYREAGAHYVARGIWDVLPLVDEIGERLREGECP